MYVYMCRCCGGRRLLRAAGLEDKHEEEFIGRCVAPWLLQEGTAAAAEVCLSIDHDPFLNAILLPLARK
jgi:hypothetical protein